ncbi:hypothetical protein OOU_Y34scaffold00173g4 [Pyricularia oryzae Y34]|uniref:Uncharacterized protein n=1 Tax=Pyricularia oryzae (strain Y34) TaxID=1143189 RepID=A0AA97P6T9_PYRO3|nr:hypothetical protein OOU_Y34scaffold00173g4 [Pyricularia oryzae Y34]
MFRIIQRGILPRKLGLTLGIIYFALYSVFNNGIWLIKVLL